MSWALVISFLKSLPELVQAFNRMADAIEKYRLDAIDKKIDVIRQETNLQIDALLKAKTNEERQKIITDINRTFKRVV